jgi:hypothetical protein
VLRIDYVWGMLKRKNIFILIVLIAFIAVSCKTKYIVNSQGGIRPIKDNMFKYDGKYFSLEDTLTIDTNSVYVFYNNQWEVDSGGPPESYIRFWSDGHVQWSYPNGEPLKNVVNNLEKGLVGFYYLKKGRLKMEFLTRHELGQVEKTYGYIENGNIILFDQEPDALYGSYNLTKWLNRSTYKLQKRKVAEINTVFPKW